MYGHVSQDQLLTLCMFAFSRLADCGPDYEEASSQGETSRQVSQEEGSEALQLASIEASFCVLPECEFYIEGSKRLTASRRSDVDRALPRVARCIAFIWRLIVRVYLCNCHSLTVFPPILALDTRA